MEAERLGSAAQEAEAAAPRLYLSWGETERDAEQAMTFAVRAETKEGNVLTLRRGFASRDLAEDHRIKLCQWRRVWVEEDVGGKLFVPPPPLDLAALGLPNRIVGPLVEYAEREKTTAMAVISEAISGYLGLPQ